MLLKSPVLYNAKQTYTPPLEPYELNDHALIIDTETVGTGPHIEIVEVAIGNIDGEILFHSLVHPVYNPIPRSTKLQRFDKSEFEKALEWPLMWPELDALISGKILIAYNASFDRRAIAAMCARHRHTSSERGWRCAMEMARRTLGIRRSLTLAEACVHFGLEGGTHRASRDVEATARLLRSIVSSSGASLRK